MINNFSNIKTWLKPVDSGVMENRKNHQKANKNCQTEIYVHQNTFGSKIAKIQTDSNTSQFP